MASPSPAARPDVRLVARRLSPPLLAVHGGAGRGHGPAEQVTEGLRAPLDAGWTVLGAGGRGSAERRGPHHGDGLTSTAGPASSPDTGTRAKVVSRSPWA